MKFLRVGGEFLVQETINRAGRVGDAEFGNIDEKLALEGATTDQDGEIVAATVSEGEADADFFAFDGGGESDEIANVFVAGGITDVTGLEVVDRDALAGIEGAFGGKKREFKTVIRGEADVAGPDGRNSGARVDFGRDSRNSGDLDADAVTNNRQSRGVDRGFAIHMLLLWHRWCFLSIFLC